METVITYIGDSDNKCYAIRNFIQINVMILQKNMERAKKIKNDYEMMFVCNDEMLYGSWVNANRVELCATITGA